MTDLRIVPPPDFDPAEVFDEPGSDDDEDTHTATGYREPTPAVTLEPRLHRRVSGPLHFAIVEREGPAPIVVDTQRICRKCGERASVLVHNPSNNDPARTHCPKCAGEIRGDMYPRRRP